MNMNINRFFSLRFFTIGIFLFLTIGLHSQELTVTNIAGNGTGTFVPGSLALETGFGTPAGMAVDSQGNIYFIVVGFFEWSQSGIYKINSETNILEKIISNLPGISGIAIDASDNIYFSRGASPDPDEPLEVSEYIYYINHSTGLVDTLAGNGGVGFPENFVDARSSPIGNAGGIKIDPTGKFLYYSSTLGGTNFIQRIYLESVLTERVAGVGGPEPVDDVVDGTPTLEAELYIGLGMGWDSQNNFYFGTNDYQIKVIRSEDNKIYHLAGTGENGYNGDDIPAATAQINSTLSGFSIWLDDLYYCDQGNKAIRKITLLPSAGEPMISRFCGTGFEEGDGTNPDGDLINGQYKPLLETNIDPYDIFQFGDGFVFSDLGLNRIRRISVCKEAEIMNTTIDQTEVCKGDEVKLSFSGDIGGGTVWNWYEGSCDIGGEAIGNGFSLVVTADESTSYFVAAAGGCLSDETCEEIKLDVSCKEYFNTFTPNGDGKNEFLEIPVLDNFTSNTVVIYNRWGQAMLTITDYDNVTNVWNGSYSGTGSGDIVDSGTYYFTAESNGELITSGWVQVIK